MRDRLLQAGLKKILSTGHLGESNQGQGVEDSAGIEEDCREGRKTSPVSAGERKGFEGFPINLCPEVCRCSGAEE